MDKFVIEGGVPLCGEVEVNGAKNAVLPIMAATLLAHDVFTIKNIPLVRDVYTMKKVLEVLGCRIEIDESGHVMIIDTRDRKGWEAPYELVKQMRASYYVLGSLMGKDKRARVSLPGGCAIGARPVDLHIKGLRSLGARVSVVHGYIEAEAEKLKGTKIILLGRKGPSVGATINTMMAASLAEGETVIEGAALEPEVACVAEFINKMGGKVENAGTPVIKIKGVKELHGCEFEVIPDRIEGGTYLVCGAMTGEILIKNVIPEHMRAVIEKVKEAGAEVEEGEDWLRVKKRELRGTDVDVAPYPGFPTDMQAQFMAAMTIAKGRSVITETIFENRFLHVPELMRMGADIKIEGPSAVVSGVPSLSGAPVMASDLRASAALVLAGLVAEGRTEVHRVYHIDRGYERIVEKLQSLGARIWRERE